MRSGSRICCLSCFQQSSNSPKLVTVGGYFYRSTITAYHWRLFAVLLPGWIAVSPRDSWLENYRRYISWCIAQLIHAPSPVCMVMSLIKSDYQWPVAVLEAVNFRGVVGNNKDGLSFVGSSKDVFAASTDFSGSSFVDHARIKPLRHNYIVHLVCHQHGLHIADHLLGYQPL